MADLNGQRRCTATLSGTPGDAEDIGDHTIFLKVMDSHGLFDTQTFTITVVETGTFIITYRWLFNNTTTKTATKIDQD